MTFGSLFAGIGGFDLGFERAGLRCKWQVEINEFCRKVLAKHWPDVRRHDDVRTFPPDDGTDWGVDVICGGFPCQDISVSGAGAGIDGKRSGLWSQYARIVRTLRPRYVVVENVSALLGRGLGRVVGDLAACGYDAEWDCIPACAVGADHRRDRLFLVAYAGGSSGRVAERRGCGQGRQPTDPRESAMVRQEDGASSAEGSAPRHRAGDVADAGCQPARASEESELCYPTFGGKEAAILRGRCGDLWGPWPTEPDVGRVAHGVPDRVDRLRGLGNAVVPQVAEWIGRRLMEC
jgi:DNA (cytosine-5)-methyltransferase 1